MISKFFTLLFFHYHFFIHTFFKKSEKNFFPLSFFPHKFFYPIMKISSNRNKTLQNFKSIRLLNITFCFFYYWIFSRYIFFFSASLRAKIACNFRLYFCKKINLFIDFIYELFIELKLILTLIQINV